MISPEFSKLLKEIVVVHPAAAEWKFFEEMKIVPTEKQLARGRVGRNRPCPCGSGRKFKRCCLRKTETKEVSSNGTETKRGNGS